MRKNKRKTIKTRPDDNSVVDPKNQDDTKGAFSTLELEKEAELVLEAVAMYTSQFVPKTEEASTGVPKDAPKVIDFDPVVDNELLCAVFPNAMLFKEEVCESETLKNKRSFIPWFSFFIRDLRQATKNGIKGCEWEENTRASEMSAEILKLKEGYHKKQVIFMDEFSMFVYSCLDVLEEKCFIARKIVTVTPNQFQKICNIEQETAENTFVVKIMSTLMISDAPLAVFVKIDGRCLTGKSDLRERLLEIQDKFIEIEKGMRITESFRFSEKTVNMAAYLTETTGEKEEEEVESQQLFLFISHIINDLMTDCFRKSDQFMSKSESN